MYRYEAQEALKALAAKLAPEIRAKVAAEIGCKADEVDMPADLMDEILGEAAYDCLKHMPEDGIQARQWAAENAADFSYGTRGDMA